jgi:serine/threonine protein kinase
MAAIKRIGKYDVLETIGRGGMGVVLKATDSVLGRLVAIKIMTDGFVDDPDLLKRFYREAQSTASLTHPNIVTVYDLGDQDGMPYLVMQFLEGEGLHAVIKSRRDLSLLTKIHYLLQICHGLQYAHERNITHRDIKPANIMVMPDGTVKIVDFGIAHIGNDQFTRPGQVMGSIHYMSPEQIDGREVDARSDIFALGTVAYELLTLSLPFQGRDVSSTLLKILRDPLLPLAAYLQDYPAEFDSILERAMAKNKQDRYQTVDEMASAMAQVELRLRREMIAKLHQESEKLIFEGDLVRASEQLQQLIKLDPQNQSASMRMRELQQEMQQETTVNPCQLSDAGRELGGLSILQSQHLRNMGVLELTPPQGVRPGALPPDVISSDLTGIDENDRNAATSLPADRESGSQVIAPATPWTRERFESGASEDASAWPDEILRTVEKQLAGFIGSLARILVKKAAARTNDLEQLYAILAASLESEADREAFLARKVDLRKGLTKSQLSREPLHVEGSAAPPKAESKVELTPAAVDHAARLLARHVGPIAGVLAKRAAQHADSPHALYLLLAEHVENKAERSRFLREAGFSDQAA